MVNRVSTDLPKQTSFYKQGEGSDDPPLRRWAHARIRRTVLIQSHHAGWSDEGSSKPIEVHYFWEHTVFEVHWSASSWWERYHKTIQAYKVTLHRWSRIDVILSWVQTWWSRHDDGHNGIVCQTVVNHVKNRPSETSLFVRTGVKEAMTHHWRGERTHA